MLAKLPDYLKPLAETGYVTGWRTGELLSRRWEHVDLDAGWIRLEPGETKNRKGRHFPLLKRLRRVLEDQWDRKRPREEGGHPERIPHDYRRAAARKLIRAGLPRSVAETLAGHKTDSVFDRFYIVDEVRLKEAGYRREALYDSRPSQNRHNQSTGGPIETISLYARGGVQTRTGGNSQGILGSW